MHQLNGLHAAVCVPVFVAPGGAGLCYCFAID
jgi:hypothetical protein